MLAALDIRVSQLVHHRDTWLSRQNAVDIHLFEYRPLVLKFPRGYALEFSCQLRSGFAAVAFHHTDDHVLASAGAANRLAQHVVCFSDAGSISQKKLENSSRLFRRYFLKPFV